MSASLLLKRIRIALVFIIFGLIASGVTAFPLEWELKLMASVFVQNDNYDPTAYAGFAHWIMKVREGLVVTGEAYPFIAYGTDWLAFGHIIIALFFLPVYSDPVRYRGNLKVGLAACILVIPLALICGPIRGIPFYWQLIDCSFGFVCIIPVWFILRWTQELENREP
ncbi:MAG: hypothetical protein O3C21_09035 [Verrucomicrobia bacterium]|nr:hypothetical protein [Verrucomicrobiota bacterium]